MGNTQIVVEATTKLHVYVRYRRQDRGVMARITSRALAVVENTCCTARGRQPLFWMPKSHESRFAQGASSSAADMVLHTGVSVAPNFVLFLELDSDQPLGFPAIRMRSTGEYKSSPTCFSSRVVPACALDFVEICLFLFSLVTCTALENLNHHLVVFRVD